MCVDYEHKAKVEKQHFSQADLLPYFAVTFEGGLSYESQWLKDFLATKDITQEERYKNEEAEMKRREALYGPYIENGFKNDDRFYIKVFNKKKNEKINILFLYYKFIYIYVKIIQK